MNKILFKLIEGKGKFFLKRRFSKSMEIVNPEVVKEQLWKNDQRITGPGWSIYNWETKMLKDGDTFDLPDGWGFEEQWQMALSSNPDSNYVDCNEDQLRAGFNSRKVIRLLPEKPAQTEESQEERIVRRLRNNSKIVMKHMMAEQVSENLIGIADELEKLFTIKRKES